MKNTSFFVLLIALAGWGVSTLAQDQEMPLGKTSLELPTTLAIESEEVSKLRVVRGREIAFVQRDDGDYVLNKMLPYGAIVDDPKTKRPRNGLIVEYQIYAQDDQAFFVEIIVPRMQHKGLADSEFEASLSGNALVDDLVSALALQVRSGTHSCANGRVCVKTRKVDGVEKCCRYKCR